MNAERRTPSGVVVAAALVLSMAVALALRVVFQWPRVFTRAHVSFQGGDAWYHMRLVDHLLANYPHRLAADPYLGYPEPAPVSVGLFFDQLVVVTAWIAGLGSPGPRVVDTVGALMPAVLGAAILLPLHVLGARLFDRRAGLVAAVLLAVMPGGFLARSQLGYADHHVLETLLAVLTVLGFAVAVGNDGGERRRYVASILAGLALGCYLLTWTSGGFLVGIIAGWVVALRCLEAFHPLPRRFTLLCGLALALASVVVLAFQPRALPRYWTQVVMLAGALGMLLGLEALSRLWRMARLAPRLRPLAVLGLCVGAVATVAAFHPGLLRGALSDLARLSPDAKDLAVFEVRPLLMTTGNQMSLRPLLTEFGSTFALGVTGLIALGLDVLRRGRADRCLIAVATSAFLVATLAQNRFAYYLAPFLALLTGWLAARVLTWVGPAGDAARRQWRIACVLALIALVVVGPGLALALRGVRADANPRPGWLPALDWLRRETSDPFGDPAFYTARYDGAGQVRRRPAYTVMAWWDFGYEIVRVGRRVPASNPTQAGAASAGEFFTTTDESDALALLGSVGARYVMADGTLPYSHRGRLLTGRFDWLAIWGNRPVGRYIWRVYQRGRDGGLVPVMLFLPEYYRSMAVRLAVFGGRASAPRDSTWVVDVVEHPPLHGDTGYVELVAVERFATHDAAIAHLGPTPRPGRVIVSFDPLQTCVPLEPLQGLRLVHEVPGPGKAGLPAVRIFEVVGR